jgi:hypothetical protein
MVCAKIQQCAENSVPECLPSCVLSGKLKAAEVVVDELDATCAGVGFKLLVYAHRHAVSYDGADEAGCDSSYPAFACTSRTVPKHGKHYDRVPHK